MEDASLMKQIAGGDEAALQALLRRYGPLIRYILRPILSDQRDREECYADISLKIWQTAGSFDETKGTLKAWLTVLSRNSALNHARRRTEADAPLEENMPHEAGSAEEALLRRERQAKLKAVIAALPPEEPPGTRVRSTGLRVVWNAEFSVEEPMANSSIETLPRRT